MSKYQTHKEDWSTCELCDYCLTRKKVVLYRGVIPCHVLFVGEAPGKSENMLGRPFVGEAGKLLDSFITEASIGIDGVDKITFGFTNLVGCLPVNEDGALAPSKQAIKKCQPRLQEIFTMCEDSVFVAVGTLAAKHTEYDYKITHPAAILRMDYTQRMLQTRKAVINIKDAIVTAANKPVVPF